MGMGRPGVTQPGRPVPSITNMPEHPTGTWDNGRRGGAVGRLHRPLRPARRPGPALPAHPPPRGEPFPGSPRRQRPGPAASASRAARTAPDLRGPCRIRTVNSRQEARPGTPPRVGSLGTGGGPRSGRAPERRERSSRSAEPESANYPWNSGLWLGWRSRGRSSPITGSSSSDRSKRAGHGGSRSGPASPGTTSPSTSTGARSPARTDTPAEPGSRPPPWPLAQPSASPPAHADRCPNRPVRTRGKPAHTVGLLPRHPARTAGPPQPLPRPPHNPCPARPDRLRRHRRTTRLTSA
jgi:hypothetical protein